MAFPTSLLGSSMVIHYVPVSGHRASAIVSDLGYMSSIANVALWIARRVVGVQRLEHLAWGVVGGRPVTEMGGERGFYARRRQIAWRRPGAGVFTGHRVVVVAHPRFRFVYDRIGRCSAADGLARESCPSSAGAGTGGASGCASGAGAAPPVAAPGRRRPCAL